MNDAYRKIAMDGLWSNNPALVQILGLCPLLAVTSTVINGLGLGIATLATLVLSNVAVSLIRDYVNPEIRIPVFVIIIAAIVTVVELIMQAYFYDLYLILGLFISLITTNCAIIARAEAFASKNTVFKSFLDGLMMGLGFLAVLVTLGAMRELIGRGTLLADAHLMFGDTARWITITVIDDYRGFLLAVLPPGAFIGLGLLIAAKNALNARLESKTAAAPLGEPLTSTPGA